MVEPVQDGRDVLGGILVRKREEVAARRERLPEPSLRRRARPTTLSLRAALERDETAFVLECKRRSPSRGVLREDYDPATIAATYDPFATAISVLADEADFGGSLDDVSAVRAATHLPVLLKDFVVDPYQIVEARTHGADAVLLLLSALDDATLRSCMAVCREYGMDALCETVSAEEIDRALNSGAKILGINHRDLRTLEIDRSRVERLAPRIPPGVAVIAESAIGAREDVRRLRPHVDGFLIGGALMAAPGHELEFMLRRLMFGAVKVCGVTRPEDAVAAWTAGATHIGCVFAESPRRVDRDRARSVFESTPARRCGVFVNEDPGVVVDTALALGLDVVQCHGGEEPVKIAALRHDLPRQIALWKAVPASKLDAEHGPCDVLLVDAGAERVEGGTGRTWDWSRFRRPPGGNGSPAVWIAGGLDPDNAAQADALGADGLDVSSGVESSPGTKDPEKLARFFGALRGRGRSGSSVGGDG